MQLALTLRTRKVKLLSPEVNKFSQARASRVHVTCLPVRFSNEFQRLAANPTTAVMNGVAHRTPMHAALHGEPTLQSKKSLTNLYYP